MSARRPPPILQRARLAWDRTAAARIAWAFALLVALGAALPSGAIAGDVAGIYDGGQTELAATLELKTDGRFAYWVSYGAVDEVSQGTWSEADGGIVLDSDPVTAPRFSLVDSKAGESDAFVVNLEKPAALPREAFSALVTLADGSSFVADFEAEGLVLPLGEDERVAKIMLALPIFEVRSDEFPVEAGAGILSFRFEPNDLGVLPLHRAFLPLRDGAYLLQRFDRTIRFRRVDP